MSGNHKRKTEDTISDVHASIMNALSKIKTALEKPQTSMLRSLTDQLTQVASLAEKFVSLRNGLSRSVWSKHVDSLDEQGVNLWNISGITRGLSHPDERAYTAALRVAAFRLVEAGMESNPTTETLIQALKIASKAAMACCENGNLETALSISTTAARFEELLRNVEDDDATTQQAIACTTAAYHAARMDLAWKEGNFTLAEYMSRKISEHASNPNLFSIRDRERLAYKHLEIGRSLLKESSQLKGSTSADALPWLQRSFSLVDRLDELASSTEVSDVAELKISVLRTMARAHILGESYDRAETVLDEVIPIIAQVHSSTSSEYQELRWLKLTVLKRRKAGEPALLEGTTAYKSIVDHMKFTEANVTESVTNFLVTRAILFSQDRLLQDLKTVGSQTLVSAVNRHCLEQAVRFYAKEPEHAHRLMLSLVIQCSKDENHSRAMSELDSTFSLLEDADIIATHALSVACLTLLWQYGGRHQKAKRWNEAADCAAKCFRKAALCYIEKGDFAQASTVIRRCPVDEASTHYVIFLTAIHQGLEEEAIRAIHDMANSPDFDRKLLLLVTQVSHKSEMRTVLLTALECLLKALRIGSNGDDAVEAMALIRCIIKLALNLLTESSSNRPALINILIDHFRTARIISEMAASQKTASLIIKDISWLWRTAYNAGVQGCADWADAGDKVTELFSIASELLEICFHESPADSDINCYHHLANAAFAAISGQFFSLRDAITSTSSIDEARMHSVASAIITTKGKIERLMNMPAMVTSGDLDRLQYFIHALRLFEAEIATHTKNWARLRKLIEEIPRSNAMALGTFEAIVDIIARWIEKSCPSEVLSYYLEAILGMTTESRTLSIEKFSRWLRAACVLCLARGGNQDRLKALGYVEQAITTLKDHTGRQDSEVWLPFAIPATLDDLNNDTFGNFQQDYPLDERQWLLATSFNAGTECFHGSQLNEAKRWFEAATVICRYVPGGESREEKIRETYERLLSRFSSAA